MKINRMSALGVLMLGLALIAVPMFAHHGTSVTYLTDKTISMSGVVHGILVLLPPSAVVLRCDRCRRKGCALGNGVGSHVPLMLKNMNVGWTRDSIKPSAIKWTWFAIRTSCQAQPLA